MKKIIFILAILVIAWAVFLMKDKSEVDKDVIPDFSFSVDIRNFTESSFHKIEISWFFPLSILLMIFCPNLLSIFMISIRKVKKELK